MSEHTPEHRLPRLVEPRKLVVSRAQFERLVDEADLPRLQEVATAINEVFADISFDRDDQGKPCVTGSMKADIELECQRCLEPVKYPIELQVNLQLVWDEVEAKALPSNREPWITGEGEADLAAILEEELLLALPVVPKHEDACVPPSLLRSGDELADSEEQTQNPFSVLGDLKPKS